MVITPGPLSNVVGVTLKGLGPSQENVSNLFDHDRLPLPLAEIGGEGVVDGNDVLDASKDKVNVLLLQRRDLVQRQQKALQKGR